MDKSQKPEYQNQPRPNISETQTIPKPNGKLIATYKFDGTEGNSLDHIQYMAANFVNNLNGRIPDDQKKTLVKLLTGVRGGSAEIYLNDGKVAIYKK